MNILICDDIQADADKMTELIADSGFEINTVTFYSSYDVMDYISTGSMVDVCFLDIIMPEMNGIALAEQLRSDGFNGEIVFLSTSKEYGPEAFQVKAFNYLLKPPLPDSVRDILDELEKARTISDTSGILVKSVGVSRFILFRDISNAEVIQHKVYFRLTDGSVIETSTNVTFAEITPQLLIDGRFTQCHRSYVINMDAVSAVQGNDFLMRSGAIIPISRGYLKAKEQYLEWILKGHER